MAQAAATPKRLQPRARAMVAARGAALRPQRTGRRGSAILEFALVLPILVSVTLLCVDFGRFAHTYIAVTNAARAGAAYGSNHWSLYYNAATKAAWQTQVKQAVTDELSENAWFDPANLNSPPPVVSQPDANGDQYVQVTVSYPFQTVVYWAYIPGYNDTLTLERVVTMRMIKQ